MTSDPKVFDDDVFNPNAGWTGLRTTAAFEGGWSDGSNGQHRPPHNYAEAPWRVGWTDGRIAQPIEEHRELLKTKSAYERSQLVLQRTREAEAAAAELAVAESREARAQASAASIDERYERIRSDRDNDRGSYSLGTGILYIAIAVVLFIADLPLSFLAADGLGIHTSTKVGTQRVGVSDLGLLGDHWKALWEPLVLALGIAVLGLFFKIVVDFFLTHKARESRFLRWSLVAVSIAVVLGTAYSYVLLGELRGEARTVAEKVAARETVDFSRLNDLGANAFILLALVLPIAGACFFSLGVRKLHNAHSFSELDALREKAHATLNETMDATTRARAAAAGAATALEFARTEPLLTDSWFAMYEHGYQRGYTTPESLFQGASIYQRCIANVERWLAIALQMQNEQRSKRS